MSKHDDRFDDFDDLNHNRGYTPNNLAPNNCRPSNNYNHNYHNSQSAVELYRPGAVQQGTNLMSASDIEYSNLSFGFKDMLKLTKKTRDIQDKIDKALEYEHIGGFVKAGHLLWSNIKKAAGVNVKTLDDLYGTQHSLVKNICGGFYGLKHLCQKHYLDLVSFRRQNNQRISRMMTDLPTFNRKPLRLMREYQHALNMLSSLRKSDPRYAIMREKVCSMRDRLNQAEQAVNVAKGNITGLDQIALGIDAAAHLLLHGKNIVELLLEKYGLVDEFFKNLPALNFTRNLIRNLGVLYGLNKTVSRSIKEAGFIENKLENFRLRAIVSRDIPSIRACSVVDALDHLNSDLSLVRR